MPKKRPNKPVSAKKPTSAQQNLPPSQLPSMQQPSAPSSSSEHKLISQVVEALKKHDIVLGDGTSIPSIDTMVELFKQPFQDAKNKEKDAARIQQSFRDQQNSLDYREGQLQIAKNKFTEDKQALEQERKEVESQKALWAEEIKKFDARVREIEHRELEAKAGFHQQHEEVLKIFREPVQKLEQEIKKYRLFWDEEFGKLEKQKKAFDEELNRRRQEFENELDARRTELENKYEALFVELRAERQSENQEGIKKQQQEIDDQQRRNKEERLKLQQQSKEIEKLQADYQQILETQYQQKEYKLEANYHVRLEELEQRERQYRDSLKNLNLERELFKEEKEYFDEKVKQMAAMEIERRENEIKEWQKKYEAARERRDHLEKVLQERAEADRRFGAQNPEEVLAERDKLRNENERLRRENASKLSDLELARLGYLVEQESKWHEDRQELQRENTELKNRLREYAIPVSKVQNLEDSLTHTEYRLKIKQARIEELQREIDDATKKNEEKKPFPECSGMDVKSELQVPPVLFNFIENEREIMTLKEFIEDIQQRIAQPDKSGNDEALPLYYHLRDLRFFLGGLAMSRLMILQGISGTGKTSLPLAFAHAIGAGEQLIEVQSGWREQQDMFGYFNTFEQKYYEYPFIKALYKAHSPFYKGRPFFIVLDEMNLSHPEYYFATVLSALELPPGKEKILELVNSNIKNLPLLLSLKGHEGKLTIPANVWFIGTANQDETTMQFADKTFDRAHIMELPYKHPSITLNSRIDRKRSPVSFEALLQLFENAETQYRKDAQRAIVFLDTYLKDQLSLEFKIGWGNRLEKQIKRFIPVIIAAGGTLDEGLDHIIAHKIFRKLKDNPDIDGERLLQFTEAFGENWMHEFANQPEDFQSLQILNAELRNKDIEQPKESK